MSPNYLKELRKRSSLTLREVEAATKISNPYLSQLENGGIKSPSVQIIYKLSKLYSVTMETMLLEMGLIDEVDIASVIMPPDPGPGITERLDKLEKRINEINTFLDFNP